MGEHMTDKERVRQEKERWARETLEPALERSPERYPEFITTSSDIIGRLYTPADLEDWDYMDKLGFPGEYPMTRGVYPTMHRGRLWTMRQFAGFGTAEETNDRFKYLLAHGETGLSTAFDFPTLYGYDTDDEMARGEFGKCGVAISSLRDMEKLFEGIDVSKVTTSMTINGPASIVWAFYLSNGLRQGVPLDRMGGTIQNDVLKEYIAQHSFIFPPEPSMRLIVDTFEYGSRHVPRWNTVSISGYHIREAGSTAIQELAFTLADGLEYARWSVDRGLDIDSVASRFSFFFNAHNDLFEEIAKYRAARRIWAREMKETFGAKDPRSWLMRFHTQTAGVSLTAQQPENNIVRVTIQALAAILGGTQSLHTNSMDEALALPSEKAVRIALRTQQILAHESGVTSTIDPLAGSYFVEWMTDHMEEEAYRYFDRIDALGGVIPAIGKGFFHREIADAAYLYQKETEDRRRIIVGVNEYEVEHYPIPLLAMDPEGEARQFARLERIRSERDTAKWERSLDALRKAAEGEENTMPFIMEAVQAEATLGETAGVLREVFGEYRDPPIY
jgi:methylmalonyl-CoA mutase N-terminal domain/subunit